MDFGGRWCVDDIGWDRFDPGLVDSDLLMVVKAAAMVERNAADYTLYLGRVFRDDPDFVKLLGQWRDDEIRHGESLGRYAELADPGYDFSVRFRRFADGYRIPVEAEASVRGSATGELLARCIVETGTSSFYSAVRDASREPVLRELCHRIAGDEFRHYKLFYDAMRQTMTRHRLPLWRRVMVAVGRIRESDDDELAFAWHAANEPDGMAYDRARCNAAYGSRAYALYGKVHAERAASMVVKAVGLDPKGWLGRRACDFAWGKMRQRSRQAGIVGECETS
ncbi:rubrerythrin family protein [Magnetospirillum sp. ME-1]|uniref:ferritin-like domain-containing protein n=1 Tax=Magnetospirillum sp. ME-1 TaxID=1639348 RepID=UPI000A17D2E9|nr:ferritin-like domain-containing protein [Magnetospirillum sp. ME-1]ARJ64930.1 rubrerythrin family protein [Magnetospirillum sp. ME-1]